MINRNMAELPRNYHLSIAKMIDDVYIAGFTDLYSGLTNSLHLYHGGNLSLNNL